MKGFAKRSIELWETHLGHHVADFQTALRNDLLDPLFVAGNGLPSIATLAQPVPVDELGAIEKP